MKIRNVDFDFDFLSVSDMERYAAAYKTMQAANTALKAKNLSGIESLRATCAVFDTFVADILGDDYEQKMGIKGAKKTKTGYERERIQGICAAVYSKPIGSQPCGRNFGTNGKIRNTSGTGGRAAFAEGQQNQDNP